MHEVISVARFSIHIHDEGIRLAYDKYGQNNDCGINGARNPAFPYSTLKKDLLNINNMTKAKAPKINVVISFTKKIPKGIYLNTSA